MIPTFMQTTQSAHRISSWRKCPDLCWAKTFVLTEITVYKQCFRIATLPAVYAVSNGLASNASCKPISRNKSWVLIAPIHLVQMAATIADSSATSKASDGPSGNDTDGCRTRRRVAHGMQLPKVRYPCSPTLFQSASRLVALSAL